MSFDYYARELTRAAETVAGALATIAVEYKRANDIKEKQISQAAAAKRLGNQGFG